MDKTPHVYAAISAVTAELAKEGIGKNRKNTQGQGYSFRGIDDVYNALASVLATHKLCILPRILTRDCVERASKAGGALFYTTVYAEFDLVSSVDGSKHTISTFGEAMDSSDKSTNKAMSAAYKYAALQAFCIPTEGDNDADAHTPEPAPKQQQSQTPPKLDDKILATLYGAKTLDELKTAWMAINVGLRKQYESIKDGRKAQIESKSVQIPAPWEDPNDDVPDDIGDDLQLVGGR